MDMLELVTGVLGLGLTVLGWFAREMWGTVKALARDLIQLQKDMSEQYVRKDDFKDFRAELLQVLQRIENKLDSKQDK
mgnify:CR=1 FL=1